MNKKTITEAIGEIEDRFIAEAMDYKCERRITMSKKKLVAIAACAALVIGVGAFALRPQTSLPVEPSVDPQPGTEMNLPAQTDEDTTSDVVVNVERSYNERIADGEDVSIETYIGKEYIVDDYSFILRDVLITQTFPEGITKDDLYISAAVVRDYGGTDIMDIMEKTYEIDNGDGELRALDVLDCIDDDGRYNGPSKEGYRWVFITMEMTNLDDFEKLDYIADMSINGGIFVDDFVERWIDADGTEHSKPLDYGFYTYGQYFCYLSDQVGLDLEMHDGQPDVKKFHNIHFDPNETKTLVIGYSISDHFVFGDLFIQLHFDTASTPADWVYVPLK